VLELAKLLISFLGGGLAGALVTEWFRRKRGRVQSIPLIERVNRLVSPELEGISLARRNPLNLKLEELKNLREYQLTLRNASTVHLQNAEVQFEFPADDVAAVTSRPTLSKTALVPVEAMPSTPWRKAFRWVIPHLPSGDSVEFTFRAVDPSSESYEAALYRSEGVVLEKVVGEPPPKQAQTSKWFFGASAAILLGALLFALVTGRIEFSSTSGEKLTAIKLGGCDLRVISLFDVYGQHLYSPWRIKHRVFDVGTHDCVIQSERMKLASPVTVKSGDMIEKESISERPPKLVEIEISVGSTATSLTTTTVPLYVEP
jgi:hypothetical protein